MPYLAVSHVGIGGKPHGCAMRLELCMGRVGCKPVQVCHAACLDCIAIGILAIAYSVHDDQDHRSPASFPVFILLKGSHTLCHIAPHISAGSTDAENPPVFVIIGFIIVYIHGNPFVLVEHTDQIV